MVDGQWNLNLTREFVIFIYCVYSSIAIAMLLHCKCIIWVIYTHAQIVPIDAQSSASHKEHHDRICIQSACPPAEHHVQSACPPAESIMDAAALHVAAGLSCFSVVLVFSQCLLHALLLETPASCILSRTIWLVGMSQPENQCQSCETSEDHQDSPARSHSPGSWRLVGAKSTSYALVATVRHVDEHLFLESCAGIASLTLFPHDSIKASITIGHFVWQHGSWHSLGISLCTDIRLVAYSI